MQWENVYVFISSTFNDMHAERDYLVKKVFPELREWCEIRKLRLIDIDLRWGVTSADSEANNTVLACLKNIDECRPFFLSFLGQRRGWVPEPEEISASTQQSYPGLKHYIGKNSVTEMEIEHALLSPIYRIVNGSPDSPTPVNHALFYFRNDNFTKELSIVQKRIYTNAAEKDEKETDSKLQQFKTKVEESWPNVFYYDCCFDKNIVTTELLTEGEDVARGRLTDFMLDGKELKDSILENLKREIEKEFPDRQVAGNLPADAADLEQQAQFIEQSSEGFIERGGDFEELDNYINSESQSMFVLAAAAGLGKTMLLSSYVSRLKRSSKKVYARFCGASDLASDTYNLWKSICDEAQAECPATLDELRRNMDRVLAALAAKGKSVIIIDAINQLDKGLEMLQFVTHRMPDGIKMVISFKEDDESLALIKELRADPDIILVSLHPFNREQDKKALISAYLEKYLKSLDDKHVQAICEQPASENPLYMKVVLSELRVFGAFKQLEEEIKRFGKSPKEAFSSVLRRLEQDMAYTKIPPRRAVSYLFGLLSCARSGLSEDEITFCFKKEFTETGESEIRDTVRLYLRQTRAFLARREGRTDFLFESFMLAAKERYSENSVLLNARIAECFRSSADINANFRFEGKKGRAFLEMPYHMYKANENEMLNKMLCDYLWIYNKIRLCGVEPAVSDCDYAGGSSADYPIKTIRESLILSANALRTDVAQLPSQLWGRLADNKNDTIMRLLAQAKDETHKQWLRPVCTCLNAPGGALLSVLANHTARVKYLAVYGELLITCSEDTTIRIWDSRTLLCKRILSAHTKTVELVFVLDDLLFSVSTGEKIVKVWDLKSFAFIKDIDISAYLDYADANCFIGNYENEVYLHIRGKILFIDANKLELTRTIPWNEDEEKGCFFSSEAYNGCLYACWVCYDLKPTNMAVTINNIYTGEKIGTLPPNGQKLTHMLYDGNNILLVSTGNEIQAWDIKSKSLLWKTPDVIVKRMALYGDKLVVSSVGFKIYDLKAGKLIKKFNQPSAGGPMTTGMVVIGNKLFSIHSDDRICVWDLAGDYSSVTYENIFGRQDIMWGDSQRLVTKSGNSICVFDPGTGRKVQQFTGHTSVPVAAVFDGSKLISAGKGGDIKVWDALSQTCVRTIQGPNDWMENIHVYKDLIIAVPKYKPQASFSVMLFDITNGECIKQLEAKYIDKSIIRDGKLLLSTFTDLGSSRMRITGYDCDSGEEWSADPGIVIRDLRSVNGKLIVVPVGLNYPIKVYDVKTGVFLNSFSLEPLWDETGRTKDVTVKAIIDFEGMLILDVGKANANYIGVMDLNTGSFIRIIKAHDKDVYFLGADNGVIYSASMDHTLKLWDFSGKQICMFCSDYGLQGLVINGRNIFVGSIPFTMQWLIQENKTAENVLCTC